MTSMSQSIFSLLLVVVCLTAVARGEVKFHRLKVVVGDGRVISEEVMYDRKNKYAILSVPGDDDGEYPICDTSNFHDLERRILAMKNIKTGRCLLVRNRESVADIDDLVKKSMIKDSKLLPYRARRNSIPVEDLVKEAGPKIAKFCKDYNTRWIDSQDEQSLDRQGRSTDYRARAKRCLWNCGVCNYEVKEV